MKGEFNIHAGCALPAVFQSEWQLVMEDSQLFGTDDATAAVDVGQVADFQSWVAASGNTKES